VRYDQDGVFVGAAQEWEMCSEGCPKNGVATKEGGEGKEKLNCNLSIGEYKLSSLI